MSRLEAKNLKELQLQKDLQKNQAHSRKPIGYETKVIHGQQVRVAIYGPKWAVDPGYMHDGVGYNEVSNGKKFDPFQAEWVYSKGAKTV